MSFQKFPLSPTDPAWVELLELLRNLEELDSRRKTYEMLRPRKITWVDTVSDHVMSDDEVREAARFYLEYKGI